jgi:hypothetical protein
LSSRSDFPVLTETRKRNSEGHAKTENRKPAWVNDNTAETRCSDKPAAADDSESPKDTASKLAVTVRELSKLSVTVGELSVLVKSMQHHATSNKAASPLSVALPTATTKHPPAMAQTPAKKTQPPASTTSLEKAQNKETPDPMMAMLSKMAQDAAAAEKRQNETAAAARKEAAAAREEAQRREVDAVQRHEQLDRKIDSRISDIRNEMKNTAVINNREMARLDQMIKDQSFVKTAEQHEAMQE